MNIYKITYKHSTPIHLEAKGWEFNHAQDKYVFNAGWGPRQISVPRCRAMGDYVIHIRCVGVVVQA